MKIVATEWLRTRWEVTGAGRNAIRTHPLCITCGKPADGEYFTLIRLGMRARNLWVPACEQHLGPRSNVVRWWPE